MTALAASPAYTALLAQIPPKIIRTEEENERYIEALYQLEQHQKTWSQEERDLADLITLLIEDFEAKQYSLPKASPLAVVEFLMEEHGLKQKDLADIFGTPSIVSEVMNGKRELNKDHICKLSDRFHVSPELFF